MEHFTPFASLAGGLLIGAAAALLWVQGGRLAGVSSIAAGLVEPLAAAAADPDGAGTASGRFGREWSWRALFVAGLVAGGLVVWLWAPGAFVFALDRSAGALVLAGLLVGFGTRLSGGCTSGHGVCGVGRLSRRSIVATGVFMVVGALSVYVVEHLLGGRL